MKALLMSASSSFDRFARFYDQDYRDYDDDLEFITALADEWGDPVLELGCGTGRVLLPLAEGGHETTGIDISPLLLDVARRKLEAVRLSRQVTLVKADLRNFALDERNFQFAFCTSNTLMHLSSQADQLACLRSVHAHLAEDGLLLIDLFNPDLPRLWAVNGLQELADQWVDPATGADVLKWSVRTFDLAEQLQETLFIYEEAFPDGGVKRTVCPFTLRFLWRSEAELLLQLAGFVIEDVLGDFDGEPYHSASDHLIVLARKKA
jgi:SAM-dependent methyltransferase